MLPPTILCYPDCTAKCALPPCQLALSPQSATPTPHQMIILQPQLYPLNDAFPHAVESKSLLKKKIHITPHLTIPKPLSTQYLLLKSVEVSDVHAGTINLYAVNLVTLERSVSTTFLIIFVDLSNAESPETSPLDFATKWVTIDDICLTWDRKILETENWLNDQVKNAAQKLLKQINEVQGSCEFNVFDSLNLSLSTCIN